MPGPHRSTDRLPPSCAAFPTVPAAPGSCSTERRRKSGFDPGNGLRHLSPQPADSGPNAPSGRPLSHFFRTSRVPRISGSGDCVLRLVPNALGKCCRRWYRDLARLAGHRDRYSGGSAFLRVMPFLYELPPHGSKRKIRWARTACSAASLLCPFRAECVSHLIGNSDSTASPGGWQVNMGRKYEAEPGLKRHGLPCQPPRHKQSGRTGNRAELDQTRRESGSRSRTRKSHSRWSGF
jgi:hypothetical protein